MMTHPTSPPLIPTHQPPDPATLAFAGVITQALQTHRVPLIRGLSESCFQRLLKEYFSEQAFANGELSNPDLRNFAANNPGDGCDEFDEFDEIVELLLDHRASPREQETWLAYAVASAAMGQNHLWQDMGLPNRKVLSELMFTHFPALAAKNSGDMKWKKFFYRQLCERAGIPICKSPRCSDCCDYRICFGPEDA